MSVPIFVNLDYFFLYDIKNNISLFVSLKYIIIYDILLKMYL